MKQAFSLNSNFALKHHENGDIELEGFAIHGGENFIVNGLYEVPESEMKNCTKTLKGKKLFKDHGVDSVDNIIGLVDKTRTTYDEQAEMKGVKYSASLMVDDSNLAQKISKGLITDVSIGFYFTPICSICGNDFLSDKCSHHPLIDDMHFICKNMDCHELSLVSFGADPGATVTSAFGGACADEIKAELGKIKDEIMTNNNNDNLQAENLELSQKVKDLEASIAKIEETHKSELEDLKLESQKEVLTLQEEKNVLEQQVQDMSEELAQFRAEAEAKAQEELNAKKEELVSLAKELNIEKTLGDVDEMSIEFIDKQVEMFKEIIGNRKVVPKHTGHEQQYNEEPSEHEQFSGLKRIFQGD